MIHSSSGELKNSHSAGSSPAEVANKVNPMVMNKKLIKQIEKRFKEKLQRKTGWGRNEVLLAYKEAVNEAIFDMLDD